MNDSQRCVVVLMTSRVEVIQLLRDEELCRQIQEGTESALEALAG